MHSTNGLPVYFSGSLLLKRVTSYVQLSVCFPPVAMIFNTLQKDDYEILFGIDLPEVLASRHWCDVCFRYVPKRNISLYKTELRLRSVGTSIRIRFVSDHKWTQMTNVALTEDIPLCFYNIKYIYI